MGKRKEKKRKEEKRREEKRKEKKRKEKKKKKKKKKKKRRKKKEQSEEEEITSFCAAAALHQRRLGCTRVRMRAWTATSEDWSSALAVAPHPLLHALFAQSVDCSKCIDRLHWNAPQPVYSVRSGGPREMKIRG